MTESPRKYVALLRAINVGGNSTMRMTDLRAAFVSFGLTDVTTYIQSGNVIFASTEPNPERLARALEKHLEATLGYRGTVFVLTREELAEAAANNPFDPARLDDVQQCQMLFLAREPDADRREALLAMQREDYRLAIHGRVLYFAYPRSSAGQRRAIDFEKVLGITGTARGWKVVDKLLQLMQK